jgi:hypothetical protein
MYLQTSSMVEDTGDEKTQILGFFLCMLYSTKQRSKTPPVHLKLFLRLRKDKSNRNSDSLRKKNVYYTEPKAKGEELIIRPNFLL